MFPGSWTIDGPFHWPMCECHSQEVWRHKRLHIWSCSPCYRRVSMLWSSYDWLSFLAYVSIAMKRSFSLLSFHLQIRKLQSLNAKSLVALSSWLSRWDLAWWVGKSRTTRSYRFWLLNLMTHRQKLGSMPETLYSQWRTAQTHLVQKKRLKDM